MYIIKKKEEITIIKGCIWKLFKEQKCYIPSKKTNQYLSNKDKIDRVNILENNVRKREREGERDREGAG